jgi:hypothetical protein
MHHRHTLLHRCGLMYAIVRRASGRAITLSLLLTAVTMVLAALPAAAQQSPWSVTVYLQQSFPKQTNTNKQIEMINQTFGVNFDTWDDVVNLSIGGQLFKRVAPCWQVGLELDFSKGGIDGSDTVLTEAGPAELKFEQTYSIYADAFAVAHYLPCEACEKAVPFVLGGVGIGYEKDTTKLTLRNEYIDEYLRAENDGWFPVYTIGVGADIYFGQARAWYLEVGGAYYWGRLKHKVKAEGGLAPAPEVEADNDTTGPNYWVGVGWRF